MLDVETKTKEIYANFCEEYNHALENLETQPKYLVIKDLGEEDGDFIKSGETIIFLARCGFDSHILYNDCDYTVSMSAFVNNLKLLGGLIC